jgi:ankyrin repeat protein
MKKNIIIIVFLAFPLQLFCMGNDYLKLLQECASDQEKFQEMIANECSFPEAHKEARKAFLSHMGYPDWQPFDDGNFEEPSVKNQMQAFQGIIGNSDIGKSVMKALQQYDGLNVEHKTTIEKYCDAQSIAGAVIGELPTSLINIAIEKKNKDAVELLLQNNKEHALFIEGDSFYSSPEKKLATGGLGIVTLVAQHNSNIIADMAKDKGILFYAIRDNIAFAQYLVERGADINAYETSGGNPVIMTALRCGHYQGMQDFVLFLLGREGININCFEPGTKNTPLHVAVEKSYIEAIKALCQKKAVCTTPNTAGEIPLHIAIRYSGIMTLQTLVDFHVNSGLDIGCNIKNKEEETPLHLVVAHAAIGKDDDAHMKCFLQCKNLNINVQDNSGYTALHNAARFGYHLLVPLLLDYPGIDVNACTNNGETALDLVVSQCQNFSSKAFKKQLEPFDKIKKLLLQSGAKHSEGFLAKKTTSHNTQSKQQIVDKKNTDNGNKKEGSYILYGGVMLAFVAAIIALMHMYNVSFADIISHA